MMFPTLTTELKKWADQGKTATFWWRDDDLQQPSPKLDKLLLISERYQAPLALATIPEGVSPVLAETLFGLERVSVLQHGVKHQNYAPASERKMELGWHRAGEQILSEIRSSRRNLQQLFPEHFVPVMVPPWNRIDARVVNLLADTGLCGLSTLGPRTQSHPATGLKQINVHVDIIDWKNNRCFVGEEACVDQIIKHLQAKRNGQADPDEPTGIMSHHLVHNADCWQFLDNIFNALSTQTNTLMLDAASSFMTNRA